MKKIVILTLCLMFLLCACGENKTETTTTAAAEQTVTTTAPAETEAENETTEAEETEAPTVEETTVSAKELAESCIDKPVEKLYALIGEPESSEYVSSCLGDGEDGNLYYDGFTVYTYKDAEGETVTFVE